MPRKRMNQAKQFFLDLKLNRKICAIYFAVLACFLCFFAGYYNFKVMENSTQKIKQYSRQVADVSKNSMESTLTNLNTISKILISNTSVQTFLRSAQKQNTAWSKDIMTQIINYMDIYSVVRSITIYDKYENQHGILNSRNDKKSGEDIFRQPWFQEVQEAKGRSRIKSNLYYYEDYPDENVISLIRIINDLDTQEPIGVLVMDVLESQFMGYINESGFENDIGILVLDDRNQVVISNAEIKKIPDEILENQSEDIMTLTRKIGDETFVFSCCYLEDYQWRVVSMSSLKKIEQENRQANSSIFIMAILTTVIFVTASMFISRSITSPINKLIISINKVKRGELTKVNMHTGRDEIGILKENYNEMLIEIEKLIQKVVVTEQESKKYELNAVYEQIKPHFLYNTLDTIGYLILAEENEKAYTAIENLGSYYRASLSHGSQKVTVQEEIKIVTDYLDIQKLRYGDVFEYHSYVDEDIADKSILKLILQPLAENALYHGIRPMGIEGNIIIRAYMEKDNICLSVEDDGMGMDQEKIESILNRREKENHFGLRGTIERIRIFYGKRDCCKIESGRNEGTKISFYLPAEGNR
ncbi:MAG: sensor histidine kinase [Dorea sp.]|nr:sensor histidine kinase [Dorea sp.]